MYFKETPTPDLSETLGVGSLSNKYTRDVLQNIESESEIELSQAFYQDVLDILETITELDLQNSSVVELKLEIVDETEITGLDIVSKNLDGTKTYINKKGEYSILPDKPIKKWPTMGKCKDCLKLTFTDENIFNFTGNIGGYFSGIYNNGQKVYDVYLTDYSSPISYGQSIPYKIYWLPNVTYNGTDYNGNPISINNQHKWIMAPASLSGSVQQVSSSTFFHVSSMFTASCPYYDPTPLSSPWYNFYGHNGFFLCELSPNALPDKPCPQYMPISGSVVWGYNCGPNGCVEGPSGSVTYTTLEQCQVSCSIPDPDPDPNYGFNCVNGNCVTGSATNTGSYATLNECQESCAPNYGYNCINGDCVQGNASNTGSYVNLSECLEFGCETVVQPITTCSCDPDLNIVLNPGFTSPAAGFPGNSNWAPSSGPGIFWNFGVGNAQLSTTAQFNNDFTSSAYLNQYEVLSTSCSYNVCFQAWLDVDNPDAVISFNPAATLPNQTPIGPFPISQSLVFTNLTTTPTAYSSSFVAGSPNFGFYLGVTSGSNSAGRFHIDNVCITLISCPPTASDCTITGSAYSYEDVEYECICPVGYIIDPTTGDCVPSGSITVPKIITGVSINAPVTTYGSWGINMPALYYTYSNIGQGVNSIASGTPASPLYPSPIFGNPNVYHTPYTFDLLKNSFWRGWNPSYNLCGLSAQLFRQIPTSGQWVGGGSFLNVTSSKTYYVALIADDIFRFSLDGNVVIENTSGANLNPQQRHANSFSSPYGVNPYLTNNLTANFNGNWTYRSLHIYPVTMSAGCHYLTLEGKDTNSFLAGFGGLILDNTPTEIANAQGDYDLNIIWDSRVDLIYDLNYGVTASCPPNTTPLGTSSCDLCITTGSAVPCGDCVECFNGILYNGYVVDAGGYTQSGRGSGGLVNTNALNNPINTWVIPNEAEWNTLITYLNNGIAPSTATGSLGTVAGGKLKDYVRDLTATCWEFPNAGAQDSSNSSGWAGVGSGKRDDLGAFSGLGFNGYWWSAQSTPNATTLATRELKNWSPDVYKNIYTKNHGHSIRLVRPAVAGEVNGTIVFNAYKGNDNKLYDGVVIGNQVWITKNLAETKYNDGTNISVTTNNNTWTSAIQSPILETSCYYDNNTSSTSSLEGNINPATGLCYEYPSYYIYQKCGGTEILIQAASGSTTIPGKVQKAPDNTCWSFVEQINTNPTANYSIYSATNYFSGSNTVYDTCDECNAIHTMYMTFGTKNC
jgi:uncharacterized protein (TIGR02145 family)